MTTIFFIFPALLFLILLTALFVNAEAGFMNRKRQRGSSTADIMAAGMVAKMLQENDHPVVHHIHHYPVFIPVHHR